MACRPRALFKKYRRRIAKLGNDAERVERLISTKLDLKQKHAALKEAHSAAVLSAAVSGFAVITVIFAPLSFVVALFALPIDMFNEGKDGNEKDGVYFSSYIGKWTGKLTTSPLLMPADCVSRRGTIFNCGSFIGNVGGTTVRQLSYLGNKDQ